MSEKLHLGQMVKWVKEAASKFPDLRTGKNTQYELEDAALGAFAVFFTQSPSFPSIPGVVSSPCPPAARFHPTGIRESYRVLPGKPGG